MKATERREKIVHLLLEEKVPMSGNLLAERLGVSRQCIVQDVSLLKAAGYEIISTSSGYLIHGNSMPERVFKVHHTEEQTEDELTLIVDLGGTVENVFVWHKVYGKLTAQLNISSHIHIQQFMEDIHSGKSTELMHITGGYHYHTVQARSEEALDMIEKALNERQYIAAGI